MELCLTIKDLCTGKGLRLEERPIRKLGVLIIIATIPTGIIGIVGTLILCIPINAIVHALTGIPTINAVLPIAGGIALIVISMLLTFIAGLIPSGLAAKKDPVVALRTE